MNNYNDLLVHYEENKDRPMNDWLTFDGMLIKPSKQGYLGLFKIRKTLCKNASVFYTKKQCPAVIIDIDEKDNSYHIQIEGDESIICTTADSLKLQTCENSTNEPKYVFKMSQYINNLAYHESITLHGLAEISKYCPHFMKGFGVIKCDVEPKYKKTSNPFKIVSKYPIKKDLLLCEFLDKSAKFYNYIKSKNIHEDVLYSQVKQVLMALCIAQKKKKFTHYDLHSNNVMIKKCNKDLVFLYKLDEENQFCVPSMGYYSIIIDYGFSYISYMENGPLLTSMAHTDVGFLSDRFDWVADPKLFLVTVSDEIKEKRGTKKAKKLRRVVKNIFAPLKIQWDSGWDDVEKKGAIDYIADLLQPHNTVSRLFDTYDYYCLDILQSLIILPLETQDSKSIKVSYETFLAEWVKIENEISNEFYNLYILKEITDVARFIRPDYMRAQTRDRAISIFRKSVYEIIGKVSKFCIPKALNFEKLLCSMYVLAKSIEGILYEIIRKRVEEKKREYDKMLLCSVEEIFATINVNIQDDYEYKKETQIMIVDMVSQKNTIFEIPENEVENVNSIHPLARGTYIYDLSKLK